MVDSIFPSVIMLASIETWIFFSGSPPGLVALDMLWLFPTAIPILYSLITLMTLALRGFASPYKWTYSIAMRDMINQIICASTITVFFSWVLLWIFQHMCANLSPMSDDWSLELRVDFFGAVVPRSLFTLFFWFLFGFQFCLIRARTIQSERKGRFWTG